jgi:hypothetical protein
MIELRISNTAAVHLLVDRIEDEFQSRIRTGIYSKEMSLDDLPFPELFELAEIAAFDLVAILPYDALMKETNINEIVAKAMQSLTVIYQKEEFIAYTPEMAAALLDSLKNIYKIADKEKLHIKN